MIILVWGIFTAGKVGWESGMKKERSFYGEVHGGWIFLRVAVQFNKIFI